MDNSFVNLGEEVILTNSDLALLNQRQMRSFACRVCVSVREGVTVLQKHTSYTVPSRAWTDAKLRTLLTVFTFILKAEARDYGKGRYISNAFFGVRPITMHCASWPIRADCACRKEGLCRKQSVWERRGIEHLQCTVFEKWCVFFHVSILCYNQIHK